MALDDSSLSLIADHLEKMVSLETLDLTACEIKNDGVVKLAKLLPTTNLKCLILSGNKLAADGCKVSIEQISQYSTTYRLGFGKLYRIDKFRNS